MKRTNLGTIIDLPWWYKIWQRSGYNPSHVKQNFPGDPEELHKVPGADEETKSHIHYSLEFGKSCEELF